MNIAYSNYGPQSGVTASLARALRERGHRVEISDATGPLELRNSKTRLPRPTPTVLASIAAGLVRFGRQWHAHRWNTPFAFDVHSASAGRALAALAQQPDAILQNGALFAPGPLGKPTRAPYVLLLDNTCAITSSWPAVPHWGLGTEIQFSKPWLRRETQLYLGARAIGTFSGLVRDSLVRDYGVDPARVQVVGAGCNVFPERVENHSDGKTFLFVGRHSWIRKGGPVLLRAFELLRRERPQARLILAGPHDSLAVPEGVTNLGVQPFEKVQELFSQATALVLPTLREPFGIAYLDALACGVPCIGTRVGAVPEILEEGRYGLLVPPGEVTGLAAAMLQIIDHPERAREMGAAGRKKVATRCRWTHVADRLLPLLGAASRGEQRDSAAPQAVRALSPPRAEAREGGREGAEERG